MKRRLSPRRVQLQSSTPVQGVGAVSAETASMAGWVTTALMLGGGLLVGLRGNFLAGGVLAASSIPAGLGVRLALRGPDELEATAAKS